MLLYRFSSEEDVSVQRDYLPRSDRAHEASIAATTALLIALMCSRHDLSKDVEENVSIAIRLAGLNSYTTLSNAVQDLFEISSRKTDMSDNVYDKIADAAFMMKCENPLVYDQVRVPAFFDKLCRALSRWESNGILPGTCPGSFSLVPADERDILESQLQRSKPGLATSLKSTYCKSRFRIGLPVTSKQAHRLSRAEIILGWTEHQWMITRVSLRDVS